jgi:hypothetical protein
MNKQEDIKLRILLQEIELESPDKNFSSRVMNKILQENEAIEKIKSERILGKGFWIFLILFIALLGIIWFFSPSPAETTGIMDQYLGTLSLRNDYQSFFAKLGVLPQSVVGIFAASSILLFIDKIIGNNLGVFTDHKISG